MTVVDVTIAVVWLGVTLYVLFAGADFGAGIWDLLAGAGEPGRRRRELIEGVIGPVWEANHVWLVFVLVVLWTGFPRAFAAVMSTLIVPLLFAAVGIIGRGAAFAFRKEVAGFELRRLYGAMFAASSLLTPFFLGTVAGALASGRVPPGVARGGLLTSWLNPTSLFAGLLTVLVCGYLAAVYLTHDARWHGSADLVGWFRIRGLVLGVLIGATALGGIAVLAADAPAFVVGLLGPALPLVVTSGLGGVASLVALRRHRFLAARLAAVCAVTSVVWGWGVAQYPEVLPGHLTLEEAASGATTMVAMLVSLGVGAVLVVPSLIALFVVFQRDGARHGRI